MPHPKSNLEPRISDPAEPLQIQELLRAQAYPHPVTELSLQETHISWIVLTGSIAYKIKKPVHLAFIDATTLERRHHYCCEELRLNRRLAPQLYEQVVAITRADGQARIGGTGPVIEYAVRMQQFSETAELPFLLAQHDVSPSEFAALGELLARFHQNTAVAVWTDNHDKTEQMYESVLGNLRQLVTSVTEPTLTPILNQLVDWSLDQAQTLQLSFQQRERSGFIREGHGDLHCANIVRSRGQLTPFDCIEFDPRLRWIDVINDIAFLVMDLISHDRSDLAFAMLSRYLEATGDYESIRLLPFYAVYRALVRAKVDVLMAQQVPARADEFQHRLHARIHAAVHWTEHRQPVLILMHGLSGSGKSWLSEQLVSAVPAIRLRSDVERKRLGGLETTARTAARLQQGIYSPEFSRRTYGRLADCAEICLRTGLNVIVDAAFLEAVDRELFITLAKRVRVPWLIVSCHADSETLTRRIRERSHRATDASDADLDILAAQLRSAQPLSEMERAQAVTADPGAPDTIARVVAAVRANLSGA